MKIADLLDTLGRLPTTQFNAVVSAIAILSTTVRYISSADRVLPNGTVAAHWVPDTGWLWFLLALAGVSTAHFIGKRLTDTDFTRARAGLPENTTDDPSGTH